MPLYLQIKLPSPPPMAASLMSRNNDLSSIFFVIILLLTMISSFSTTLAFPSAHPPDSYDSEVFSEYISPSSLGLKEEKLAHLHFYWHDFAIGKNATAVRVAEAPSSNKSSTAFGVTVMMDDPLTITPDINSKMVGRAQGIYAFASESEVGLLMVFNFVFTEGKYNGSTLSVLGRNRISAVREMPIVGGSGVFRFARGYALAKTYVFTGGVHDIVEYNVYVFHY